MTATYKTCRRSRSAWVVLAIGTACLAGGARAQELTHRFLNPSFGGNPFYSDHLLSVANVHRPEKPEDPPTPAPTEEELIASQIRSRLLSQLSGDILSRIQAARPGESGQFEFGDQLVNFTRTATETRVIFTNSRTGESRVVVIPVAPPSGFSGLSVGSPSAEQMLGSPGATLRPLPQ